MDNMVELRESKMAEQKKIVPMVTVGLNSSERMLLETQLNPFPEIQLQHMGDWDLAILEADVVLVSMDSDAGYETLQMMKSLKGAKRQMLVTCSCDGQRLPMGVGELVQGGRSLREPVPGFCHHLREILRNVNCFRTYAADETASLGGSVRAMPENLRVAAALHKELNRELTASRV